MPKVTVVIPTCDRPEFLRRAIESVLRQTFEDFEIIVVDDASKDDTERIVGSFTDARIRYIRRKSKQGQGRTRNIGIRSAGGEYIALLDDDDEWLPEKLQEQVRLMDRASPRVGMVYTGYFKVDGATMRVLEPVVPEKRGDLFESLCSKNWVGTCSTVLLRKTCFDQVGLFDEELASAADYDMWLRVAKEFEIEAIPRPLARYTVHGNSITSNLEAKIRGLEGQFLKHGPLFAKDRKSHSRRYLTLGVAYCYRGDLEMGRESFIKGIRLNPLEMRHYFNLGLSFLGKDNFKKLKTLKERFLPWRPCLFRSKKAFR